MMEEKDKVICFSCLGIGRFPEEGYAECPYCDGTGWVDDSDGEYEDEYEDDDP